MLKGEGMARECEGSKKKTKLAIDEHNSFSAFNDWPRQETQGFIVTPMNKSKKLLQ